MKGAETDLWLEGVVNDGDAVTATVARRNREAGLADIAISPLQGKFLMIFAAASGARRILEIGTLGGYSTLWLARAAGSGGRVVSLEIDPRHAAVARDNARAAGFGDRIDVVEGPGLSTLARLAGGPPFDFAFIDADKESYPDYLAAVVPLMRLGGVIVADNVVRAGAVADPDATDPKVLAVRAYLRAAASDPRLETTVLQTIGAKGHDGFAISRVVGG